MGLTRRLLCLMALLLAWAPASPAAGPPGGRAAAVVVAEVREIMLAPSVLVSGTVLSRQRAEVPAEVAGRLLWVAELGSRIGRGEPLARLDDSLFRLQLQENQAALAREQARRTYLQRELERLAELNRRDYASQGELDKLRLDYDLSVAELAVIEARLAHDRETLRRYRVRAPFSGVVVSRQRREGEWVTVGDTVLSLADPDTLDVQLHVDASSIAHLRPGATLAVYQGERRFDAPVRALVPVGDTRSHLFQVRLDATGSGWRAGQVVRVQVPTDEARPVLAVPRDALVLRSRGAAVFRIDDAGVARRVAVETGGASGELIEIRGDLRAGDRVVVRGAERLRPGQKVRILPEHAS